MFELRESIRSRLPAMLEDLDSLVHIESPTPDKAGVDRAQDYLCRRLRWADAEVERVERREAGDHLMARWVGSADNSHRQILILGHVDTVWPIGELARRPTRREDGCFFGPGAFDMKAGLIMATHAMQLLVERDPRLSCDVVFIVSGDEEVGSLTCRSLIEEQARKSMAVLVVEPPARDGHLTVARKGVGRYTIRVKGKATHAGRSHAEGVNAIEELARQVLHLQSLTGYAQGATVNVGVFRGGMRPNVVPAEALAELDLRVVAESDAERLDRAIRGLACHDPRARLEVSGGLTRPPWPAAPSHQSLFQRAESVAARLGMALAPLSSGGGSDGNLTAALNIPTLDGLGPEGAGAHEVSEYVRIESMVERGALLAGLLLDLNRDRWSILNRS